MAERLFRGITDQRLWLRVFKGMPEGIEAIDQYIPPHTENPKPFIWTNRTFTDLKLSWARERC
ncbi:MAG: hypothetical protein DRJ65_06560 [Acidobacteria bacterium]|nr:MAG: hypothetical protein DRJ65_06560 [Acidobacteriota bacterium]